MKKFFAIVLASVIMILGYGKVSAQSNAFPEGSIGINAGFGLGSVTWGSGFLPSFNLSGDYSIKNLFNDNGSVSGGALFGFGSNKDEFSFRVGVRGAIHYTFVDNLDTYAGMAMGIKHSKGKQNEEYNAYTQNYNNIYYNNIPSYSLANAHEPETHFIYLPLFVGARYLFTDNIGAFAETAISRFSYFQVGVTLQF